MVVSTTCGISKINHKSTLESGLVRLLDSYSFSLPSDFLSFVKSCLEWDPEKRIEKENLVDHRYFSVQKDAKVNI